MTKKYVKKKRLRKGVVFGIIILSALLSSCGLDSCGDSKDTTAPKVISNSPDSGSSNIILVSKISVNFSEAVKSETLNNTSFTVLRNGSTSLLNGTVALDSSNTCATFTPSSVLESSSTYTVTLKSTIADKSGNKLESDYTFSFTTGTSSAYSMLIMFYADADNDLERYIMADINELESVDLSAKNIKIIVLVDRNASYWTGDGNWSDSRAYEIQYDSPVFNTTLASMRIAIPDLGITPSSTSVEVNMGDAGTLEKFVKFCNDNYPADKRMLLLTNHGGGWRENPAAKKARLAKIGVTKAVCWDDTSGDDACLYTSQLRSAISSAMGTTKLDIVAFDACLMGMIEVAYELKDVANYMVASEETIPGYGFPYTAILNGYSESDTAVTFGTSIVDKYYSAYINGTNVENPYSIDDSVTLSLIDLSKISALAAEINNLGSALSTAIGDNPEMDIRMRSESFAISDYVDIKDYCVNETVCTAERAAVVAAFDAAVIYNMAGSGSSGAKGISMFMPVVWSGYGEQADYTATNLQFASFASSWVSYLNGITASTATDQNEIEESANGGFVNVTVPSIETGYIYFSGDMDIYNVSSDGTFNLKYEYSGSGTFYVDVYIYNKATYLTVNNLYTFSPGADLNISYNPTTEGIEINVYSTSETFSDINNPYKLTFTDN